MAFFRTVGDILHLGAIAILLFKMLKTRSVSGVSLKSMFLFALVFSTRYVDIFFYYIDAYNYIMKLLYLSTSYYTCFLIRYKAPWKNTYDKVGDGFRIRFLIVPCIVLTLIVSFFVGEYNWMRILWTFSQLLESVAIFPQIYLLESTERHDVLTTHYLLCLGLYRLFYLVHWIVRWTFYSRINALSVICGVVQTMLYVDFFCQYFRIVLHQIRRGSLD